MAIQTRYTVPGQQHQVEEEIKRSRFITSVAYAPSTDEARSFIARINEAYSDASHNCWAYVVGPPGSTANIGMSDAGEPHGTAGKPMLTVLLHSDIGDICAVVTRYFGGTLLGKGGLVRAYSGGVRLALDSLPTVEKVPRVRLQAVIGYSIIKPLQRMLPDFEAEVIEEEFSTDVTYRLSLPLEHKEAFVESLINLTRGDALIEVETDCL